MPKILILGAGRSSSSLIDYTLNQSEKLGWDVSVGDFSQQAAQERINQRKATAIAFDIQQTEASRAEVSAADVVISLIPAHLHPLVAKICLEEKKHLLTASYVSPEMKSFHTEAMSSGLLFLNECGLDPGIDHMSAMQVIDQIKSEGGKLTSFESFTGGLIAPETDPENPWRYKFTWNPRNVVMAGQSTAKYLQDGEYKFIPYQQLFQRITPVMVPGFGEYEGYANRDSLSYLETYQLQGIKTMLRGTLRNKGYCSAWNILVQLGCCDDSYLMEDIASMTHRQFINSFLDLQEGNAESKIESIFRLPANSEEIQRLKWSRLFSDEPVGLKKGTPAQVLEHILNKKWKLTTGDRDFIVMWHRFRFLKEGKGREIQAYLTAKVDDETRTAMAKTVGLPLGIAAKLLLQGKIKQRGVAIPVTKEFYEPVLNELGEMGIRLVHR
ncbi:MAG: saccharopine dehydrogenase family protein [Cytophagales bacterium]